MRHANAFLLATLIAGAASTTAAAPLPATSVPDPLKTWVPWVMQGHEVLLCPAPYNRDRDSSDGHTCVWPSHLELQVSAAGATFRYEVEVFGAPARVELPGEPGRWPQDVKLDGRPLAVVAGESRPLAELAAGSHVVTGALRWQEIPEDLLLPKETGSLRVSLGGKVVDRVPDADGRILLERSQREAQASDAITVRVSRLIDDGIPLHVTTHYDIAISGKPREIQLPAALLPGFVADSLESQLPVRLQEQGLLRVQGRPGNWTIDIGGRLMAPTNSLLLPAGQADEIWSFSAHNDLRLVTVEGVPSVDPKQVPIPEAWRAFPAYQVKAGQAMKLAESRRGNPQPAADRLTLARQIWLDFDGGGYTMQDAITGTLSRSWRLEVAPADVLGRASANGVDQPITRRAGAPADGVELRHGALALTADSRLDSSARTLSATGWAADFSAASAQLNLPPGWRLLHAGGVDRAEGSWLARWSLWDFFFILLTVLGAAKLLGRKAAAVLAGALVLTWHVPFAPHFVWLFLLALIALQRVLPVPRWRMVAGRASELCVAVIALWLVPFAVQQIRLSFYPALEHPWLQAGGGASVANGSQFDQRMRSQINAATVPEPAPAAMAAPELRQEELEAGRADRLSSTPSELDRSGAGSSSTSTQAYGKAVNKQALNEIDPRVKVQTGPGLPAWQWNAHRLLWQGPVQSAQNIVLYLLPPAGTVVFRLGGLALLVAALWALASRLPGWPTRLQPRPPAAPA
ncbi:MAG: hypothetical protein M3Z29_12755, partial [Pseudomonadota bacterium]|nr:hypothetical protein [Pseudomonadota bacterium]